MLRDDNGKLDIKGIAAIGSLVVSITSFVWNKAEGCADRAYNKKVAQASYDTLAGHVNELTGSVNTIKEFLGIASKESASVGFTAGALGAFAEEKPDKLDKPVPGESVFNYAMRKAHDNKYEKMQIQMKAQLPNFDKIEQKAAE